MRHFLPKRSSSAAAPSHPKSAMTQHKHLKKESKSPLPLLMSALSPCSDQSPKLIQTLVTWAETWQAIPGVLMNLLAKRTEEMVPPVQSELGFYSRYFLIPKKDGGLRSILDLRHMNCTLMERAFRITTLKQIPSQIHPGDWFFSLDLKDAYFHIQIAPPSQTILEIRLWGSGLSIHGPSLWSLADRNSLSQQPRWLACLSLVKGRAAIPQIPPPQPHRMPGTFSKSVLSSQPMNFIPGSSFGLSPSHEVKSHEGDLKWSVFTTWCSTCGEDLTSCDISVILSFLQELLDKQRSPSTLKVYVSAIVASHAPVSVQLMGRN